MIRGGFTENATSEKGANPERKPALLEDFTKATIATMVLFYP